jgi:putative transposase
LISRRITQREFLLRPDDKVNQVLVFLVLRAAQMYGVGIVGALAMSDHWHLVVHDFRGNLPRFMQYLHSLTARVINAIRGRWENVWDVEQVNINYLVDVEDVVRKAVYVLANPVKAQLVERSIHWPGFNTYEWLDGRTVMARRPAAFFSAKSKLPKFVTGRLIAPPSFEGTFAEWAERVRAGVAGEERRAASERARTGTRVFGRRAVRRCSPHERAKSKATHRGMKPFISAKNPESRRRAAAELRGFRTTHERRRLEFIGGRRTVQFPPGTWALVHVAGVLVAPS